MSEAVKVSEDYRSSLARMSDDLSDPQYAKGYEKGWNDGRVDGQIDIVELLREELEDTPERLKRSVEAIVKEFGAKTEGRPAWRPSHARSGRRG